MTDYSERTFNDLVECLTTEHHVTVNTDDGSKITTEDGLIQQLRDAMFGGNDRGAATANKTKLPLNAPAMDLYQLIDRQIAEVWGAVSNKIPGTDKMEALLARWASHVTEDSMVEFSTPETIREADRDRVIWIRNETNALKLLRRWATQIEELFDPPRTADILAACIRCGEREVWRQKDGENVTVSALVFVRNRETGDTTEARCQACGESWWPYQFLYLAEAIKRNESIGLPESAETR